MLTACRRRGLAVHPWTVDALAEIAGLVRQGVSGVFTNDPRRVISWRK